MQKFHVGIAGLFDAMAIGKPAITTENPYTDIANEKQSSGYSVPEGDVKARVTKLIC